MDGYLCLLCDMVFLSGKRCASGAEERLDCDVFSCRLRTELEEKSGLMELLERGMALDYKKRNIWKGGECYGNDKRRKFALQSMLDVCEKKFGELSIENIVISSACDSCSGSCKGHGISVWTACDVR